MSRSRSLSQGAVVGAAAGLVGSLAMTLFLAALRRLLRQPARVRHPQHSLVRGTTASAGTSQRPGGKDDATVRVASRLSQHVFHRRLGKRGKALTGPFVHYAFGAATGAICAVAAAADPRVTRGYGTAFGTALWLLADEIINPALRLSEPPWRNPWRVHAWALGAHFVYGGVTEAVRRRLRTRRARRQPVADGAAIGIHSRRSPGPDRWIPSA